MVALAGIGHVGYAHGPRSPGEAEEFELLFLPSAEAALDRGDAIEAERIYRETYSRSQETEERLALLVPWLRAAIPAGNAEPLLSGEAAGDKEERWAMAVSRASVAAYVQDLHQASEELVQLVGSGDPGQQFVPQILAWSEEIGEPEQAALLFRGRPREDASPEELIERVRIHLRAGEKGAAENLLRAQGERLISQADFWRSSLAKFSRQEALPEAARVLEPAWTAEMERPEVLFALGELRLFQGRTDEARELWWKLVAMPEPEDQTDGFGYFRRLNDAYHSRFGAKFRIGEATGRYGTEMSREFAFLGLRQDVRVRDAHTARTAALLYLRDLEMPEVTSGEFLQRVASALDEQERPAAQRIFAFAILGAARAVVGEVEAFVARPGMDNVGAEFALYALNRYVLSTDKFRDLRDPMVRLAEAMQGKIDEAGLEEARRRAAQMREQVLRRLGAEQVADGPAQPEEPLEQLSRMLGEAMEEGDLDRAEAVVRAWEQSEQGRDIPLDGALLRIGSLAAEEGDDERMLRLAVEVVQRTYSRSGDRHEIMSPLRWPAHFPPQNTILGFEHMEALQELLHLVAEEPRWTAFKEALAGHRPEVPRRHLAAAALAETSLLWWAGDHGDALEASKDFLEQTDEPPAALVVLHGHLLGHQERFQEAEALLQEHRGREGVEAAADRLLFAFAVSRGQRDRAAEIARQLPRRELGEREQLEVAQGLATVGLHREAVEWLRDVRGEQLEVDELRQVQRLRLRGAVATGGNDDAAAQAMTILLANLPGTVRDTLTEDREEALRVLDQADRLVAYRDGVEQLANLMPNGLSLLLLLGEVADYQARHGEAEHWAEAIDYYRRAVRLRPGDGDLLFDLAEWAAEQELYEVAVEEMSRLLEIDAQAALLDASSLFHVYRQAGALERLVLFLEEWEAPEARSVDEFYGLQPTEHLFHPLGENLLEVGEDAWAERAWRKGIEMNPLVLSLEMRVKLIDFYYDRDRPEEALEVVKTFGAQANPDPELYLMNPFVSAVPQWMMNLAPGSSDFAPTRRILSLTERYGQMEALKAAARTWTEEDPANFSAAMFDTYLQVRFGGRDAAPLLADLRERFPEEGVFIRMWEGAEDLFGL